MLNKYPKTLKMYTLGIPPLPSKITSWGTLLEPLGEPLSTLGGHVENIPKNGLADRHGRSQNVSGIENCR